MTRSPRAPFVRLTAISLCAVLALLASACGSSQSPIGPSGLAAATRTSDTWPLADHVVSPAGFPGFVLRRPLSVVSSALAWTAVERAPFPAAEAARLKAFGFVRGLDEQLYGRFPIAAEVISVVEQYRTTAGARAELAYQHARLMDPRGGTVSTFPVGIPGAHGVRIAGGGSTGLNVLFSAGAYYYVVAAGHPPGARSAPTTRQLVAAADSLYLAVTGCAAPDPGRPPAA